MLTRWSRVRTIETVAFASNVIEESGRPVVNIYSTFDFDDGSALYNLGMNYKEVRGIKPKQIEYAKGDASFEVEFDEFALRLKPMPFSSIDESLNIIENSFSDYMGGNGDFKFDLKGIGNVSLIDSDSL
jgi:hypothetical protein